MKITKRQLSRMINEELRRVIKESTHDNIDPEQVSDLAQILSKSSAVQNAIDAASEDPKIIAALKDLTSQSQITEGLSAEDRVAAFYGALGASHTAVGLYLGALVSNPAIALLGMLSGVSLAALGALVAERAGEDTDPGEISWEAIGQSGDWE